MNDRQPATDHVEEFQTRRAVVTGASRNIGAAIAMALAREGYDLVLVARREHALRSVAETIVAETGRDVVRVATDLADVAAVDSVLHAAADGPPIDALVNNAYGSASLAPARDVLALDPQDWSSSFELNVLAPYRLTQAFGRSMRDRESGSIVNVVTNPLPVPGFAIAGATKAALWSLTRYLAMELAPAIRVNAVCPGTIADPSGPARAFDRRPLLDTVPMRRHGRPEEVASAVAYLVSPRSSYVTGALLTVNGGRPW